MGAAKSGTTVRAWRPTVCYAARMNARAFPILTVAILAAGCVSHEGTYSPDCIAYEGSNIRLEGGRFFWERFTDQVIIDADGKVVDQFPGYPKQGSYRIEGQAVHLESDAGEAMDEMYLQRRDSHYYLLTREQFEAWRETGSPADCPLMLGGDSGG